MGICTPIAERRLIETGAEPQYFITEIARAEQAGPGNVRLYCASDRHGTLHLEYIVVVPVDALAILARQSLAIAADNFNLMTWRDIPLSS